MYTIKDYLNYYGCYSINDVKWNMIDNFLLSILVYLPIIKNLDQVTIGELPKYTGNVKNSSSFVAPYTIDILKQISNSKRYKKIIVTNFKKILNNNLQFGAATFRINNKVIVVFEGTDGSYIGWIENFRLLYKYPCNTQKEALKYLEDTVFQTDTDIIVCGHSKGGNLAISSVMECSDKLKNKVSKIYNFDGPGFRKEIYDSKKFNEIKKKIVNIVPANSYVGILLNNDNYTVIKSNAHAFYEHNPVTWNIFGEFFVESKLTLISRKLHKAFVNGLNEIDQSVLEDSVEDIIKALNKRDEERFVISLNDVITVIKNRKNMDPKTAKYLLMIINTFIDALGK